MDARGPDGLPESALDHLRNAVVATRQLFGAAACSCALVDAAGEVLTFVAADGAGAAAIVGVEIPVSRGIAGWAALSGQAIAVADVAGDARFARDVAESTDYVPRSLLAAPLMTVDGEVAGVLEVLDPARAASGSSLGEHHGSAAEIAVLTLVASQVAAVLRLAGDADAVAGPGSAAVGRVVRRLAAADPASRRLVEEVLSAVTDAVREQERR